VSGEYGREEAETSFEYKRMKLETSGVRLGMSSFYGPVDWLMAVRPAEIGRYSGEEHLALQLSSLQMYFEAYMELILMLVLLYVLILLYAMFNSFALLILKDIHLIYILKSPNRGMKYLLCLNKKINAADIPLFHQSHKALRT
jgi:hypothetical protein